MPQLASLDELRSALSLGAVGIGERHDKDWGRQPVMEWMLSGEVKGLILEISVDDDDPHEMVLEMMEGLDLRWQNLVGYGDLLRLAKARSVDVYGWDPGDSFKVKSATTNARNRNQQVIQSFMQRFAAGQHPSQAIQHAAGHVFLFGSNHFGLDRGSLNLLLADALPWLDCSKQ